LALAVGTVLLLGSLSLLASALAAWRTRAAEQHRRLQEDGLHSAAHWIVDRLATSHRCLLPLPSRNWQPSPCPADPAVLLAGTVAADQAAWSFRATRWEPGAGEALLALEARGAEGTWRPGRFRVALDSAGAVSALRLEAP
ncbi:MAG: hypothetical protein VKI81_05475, partial [Synechococcaceae cyanobacterium]|nr:hypothetical protein [Synechococcaceae cyanobacterium]